MSTARRQRGGHVKNMLFLLHIRSSSRFIASARRNPKQQLSSILACGFGSLCRPCTAGSQQRRLGTEPYAAPNVRSIAIVELSRSCNHMLHGATPVSQFHLTARKPLLMLYNNMLWHVGLHSRCPA